MRIYYIANDCNTPVGGIKVAYQHVELLCELGHDAKIIHQKPPFRCDWFQSKVPVAYWHDVKGISYPDLWVVPEGFECPMSQDVLVFNQNPNFTFAPDPPTKRFPHVLGTLVVSEESKKYIQYAFPGQPAWVVHNFVDETLFKPSNKKNQICFMPRKGVEFSRQVFGLLRHKGYQGDIVAMDGLKEIEVAKVMAESMVYVHFGLQEGEALPILEASSSGCAVVQFDPFWPERCVMDILSATENRLANHLFSRNTRKVCKSTLKSLTEMIEKKEMAVL